MESTSSLARLSKEWTTYMQLKAEQEPIVGNLERRLPLLTVGRYPRASGMRKHERGFAINNRKFSFINSFFLLWFSSFF
uniref:Uncharacterized protein n=1 Tax=Cucumis melo TaxID=3656 RepID=A0A9I9EHD8_CUCME